MKFPLCLGFATLLFCSFCGSTCGQTLHAVSWTASGSLFDVNQATGAVFNPRPTNLTLHMVGIAYRAADGFAYVLSDESFAWPYGFYRLSRISARSFAAAVFQFVLPSLLPASERHSAEAQRTQKQGRWFGHGGGNEGEAGNQIVPERTYQGHT